MTNLFPSAFPEHQVILLMNFKSSQLSSVCLCVPFCGTRVESFLFAMIFISLLGPELLLCTLHSLFIFR